MIVLATVLVTRKTYGLIMNMKFAERERKIGHGLHAAACEISTQA
jgi:hypothetical protein